MNDVAPRKRGRPPKVRQIVEESIQTTAELNEHATEEAFTPYIPPVIESRPEKRPAMREEDPRTRAARRAADRAGRAALVVQRARDSGTRARRVDGVPAVPPPDPRHHRRDRRRLGVRLLLVPARRDPQPPQSRAGLAEIGRAHV